MRLALLVLAATVAAAAIASAKAAEIKTPLDAFGLNGTVYRDMRLNAEFIVMNPLEGRSPPYGSWAPKPPADLTCKCSVEPAGWLVSDNCTRLTVPGNGSSTCTATMHTPWNARLGAHDIVLSCNCSYTCWGYFWECVKYNQTSNKCIRHDWVLEENTCSIALNDTSSLTIIPRVVNQSLLGLDLNVTPHPPSGESSVLVNISVTLYNLGLGLRIGNETPIPVEKGMLLLHNLTVLVNNKTAINMTGYGVPAQRIPVSGPPEPSASGIVTLVLGPPGRPTNTYTFNATICYTEDKPEPVRTCVSQNITVPLPFGWRLVRYIADDCRVINETWQVVPANETSVKTVLAGDRVKPSLGEKNYCIVASAGACEPVRLEVRQGGGGTLVASRTGLGSTTWCPLGPGTYTAVAVDYFNNTAVKTLTITWSAGPPPAVKRALLGLAATIIAVMAALYIILEGRWPLR